MLFISRSGAGHENVAVEVAAERLDYWHESLVTGKWDRRITERTAELNEKTLGIIGLGRIGREVAARAKAFKMRLVAHDPYVDEAIVGELEVEMM